MRFVARSCAYASDAHLRLENSFEISGPNYFSTSDAMLSKVQYTCYRDHTINENEPIMIRLAQRHLALSVSILILIWQNAALASGNTPSSSPSAQVPGARTTSSVTIRESVSKWRAPPGQAAQNEQRNRDIAAYATGVPTQNAKRPEASK
ncbi:hypothetical protein J2776_002881 [Paraburkholderia caledonica]|uniref:Uncharacterized protein n=1 Tax=Paraburkholderia caledonica TaxID=134536 RepID=A0ABU1KYZ2_9BURK|nr:hypothetical protein [Paraburkholderia caledonica]